MNTTDLAQPEDLSPPVSNREGILARYRRIRSAGQAFGSKLVKRLSTDVLNEGGSKLGILQGGTLVFNTEHETSVLMDYCIYDVRRNGRNCIEQYLIDSPPDPDSVEMLMVRAMHNATYSLFVVESVEPGLGIIARDLLGKNLILVVDMGFSQTASPGLVFASRLVPYDEFSITGGAALPLGVLKPAQKEAFVEACISAFTVDEDGHFDPAPLIRGCLKRGSSSHVAYQDAPGSLTEQERNPGRIESTRIGRNDRCPCGSGKKFKQCCLLRS